MARNWNAHYEAVAAIEREARDAYKDHLMRGNMSLSAWTAADEAHKKWIGAVEGLKSFFQELKRAGFAESRSSTKRDQPNHRGLVT